MEPGVGGTGIGGLGTVMEGVKIIGAGERKLDMLDWIRGGIMGVAMTKSEGFGTGGRGI